MEFHFGGSPGGGMTEPMLSRDPLATEGEATFGPDDVNPYRELEMRAERRELERRASIPRYENEFVDDVRPPADGAASFELEFDFPDLGGGSGPSLPDF